MKKQKICIIGGGLTGLITAIAISKLNIDIDLITENINQKSETSRTIAISQNNLDFIKKLDIFNKENKKLWPCSKIKLYSEIKNNKFPEIFEINNNYREKEQVLYMLKNSTLKKEMIKKIRKINSISIINNKIISKISSAGSLMGIKLSNRTNKYNLIIICTGSNSTLVKNNFSQSSLEHTYEEVSVTTIIDHNYLKNNIARQIFLDDEIMALLPLSNKKTAIVWSIKKKIFKNDDDLIKKRIKFFTKNFLSNIKFLNKIEYKNLNFLIRNKYYKERILLFGDALHVVHPFAGQGFNMILRDLGCLEKIFAKKIGLGLDIGNSDTLNEFSDETKPKNLIYSVGLDALKKTFSLKNQLIKDKRNNLLRILNSNNFTKKIFYRIANSGL
tara:strand:+ start:7881 stop:9041 length:1161 start_codon:yes stop_codon:yes gene_type:complete